MDKQLLDFFEKFHQILGIDTQGARDEAMEKLDKAIILHAMECLMKGLSKADKKRCDEFLRASPQAPAIADFFRSIVSSGAMEKGYGQAVRTTVERYVKVRLDMATGDQKETARKLLEKFARSYPQGAVDGFS